MHLDRRTFLGAVGATTAASIASPLLTDGATAAPSVAQELARDLRVPWGIAFLPSGDALVTERRTAKVHRVSRNGGKSLVGTIAGVDTGPDQGEGGLLGCALSPSFSDNRHVFFYLTSGTDNRVIRMTYDGGGLSERRLILGDISRGEFTHDGGGLGFDSAGHLFISTGDARDDSLAQDLGSLNGKILRLHEDGSVPDDNPFTGSPIWTYGHRNVQGFDWDPDGQLWASEFGENTHDELNRIAKGGNYGWPQHEGRDGGDADTVDPFVTWTPTSSCSPSGLAVARGRAWVGALAGNCLFSVRLSGPNARTRRRYFHGRFGRIRTVKLAPDGSLWITTSNRDGRGSPAAPDDRVIRLTL